MGIVNVTPDSFSDGGQFLDPQAAIDHGLALAAAGADVLDVGGESTRPYATPVEAREELRRVLAVVGALAEQSGRPVSIDTSKALVAREALAAGAEIINDVTALGGDPAMLGVAVEARAGVCLMHMRGTPQTMQDDPRYDDVVGDVYAWLAARRDAVAAAGVEPSRIALDPGIGFGKTHAHNLALMAHADRILDLGCPVLVGPSRKGFLGKLLREARLGGPEPDRTLASVGAVLALARLGVQVVRVHDVAAVAEALVGFEACGGLDGTPRPLPPPGP